MSLLRPDRVMVINRAVDTDRADAFDQRWAAAAPDEGYERVEAADRPDDPAFGLYESHLRCLDAAGDDTVLVFEDDAVFTPGFRLALPAPPAGWFLLRLGGLLRATATLPATRPTPGPWVPAGIIHHTHAYVAGYPRLLAAAIRARPSTDIGTALMLGLPGHWRLVPGTVGQAAGPSTISPDRVRAGDQFW